MSRALVLLLTAVAITLSNAHRLGLGGILGGGLNIGLDSGHSAVGGNFIGRKHGGVASSFETGVDVGAATSASFSSSSALVSTGGYSGSGRNPSSSASEIIFDNSKGESASGGLGLGLGIKLGSGHSVLVDSSSNSAKGLTVLNKNLGVIVGGGLKKEYNRDHSVDVASTALGTNISDSHSASSSHSGSAAKNLNLGSSSSKHTLSPQKEVRNGGSSTIKGKGFGVNLAVGVETSSKGSYNAGQETALVSGGSTHIEASSSSASGRTSGHNTDYSSSQTSSSSWSSKSDINNGHKRGHKVRVSGRTSSDTISNIKSGYAQSEGSSYHIENNLSGGSDGVHKHQGISSGINNEETTHRYSYSVGASSVSQANVGHNVGVGLNSASNSYLSSAGSRDYSSVSGSEVSNYKSEYSESSSNSEANPINSFGYFGSYTGVQPSSEGSHTVNNIALAGVSGPSNNQFLTSSGSLSLSTTSNSESAKDFGELSTANEGSLIVASNTAGGLKEETINAGAGGGGGIGVGFALSKMLLSSSGSSGSINSNSANSAPSSGIVLGLDIDHLVPQATPTHAFSKAAIATSHGNSGYGSVQGYNTQDGNYGSSLNSAVTASATSTVTSGSLPMAIGLTFSR